MYKYCISRYMYIIKHKLGSILYLFIALLIEDDNDMIFHDYVHVYRTTKYKNSSKYDIFNLI